ncbi:MAG: amino acid/polyamine/organocation transporter, superfamily [Bacteroidetes bacterium]|nr:amino acid/polyamine/organocation transporter, superfamily [Bacteroidota bacterium]
MNLNSIPVVGSIGPAALVFWVLGFLFFFLPQSVAVIELSSRFPQEGGIYVWSKRAFGDFHGFLSGWCYWTNNIFYIPTLLFYIVGFAAFVGGDATAGLSDDPLLMSLISLALLWVITGFNIVGLRYGSIIQALGVAGTALTAAILVAVGAVAARANGIANPLEGGAIVSAIGDWRTLSLLSVVCLNFVGLELGSVMGDELKEPRRIIPRAVLIAGGVTILLYLMATAALQASIPAAEIGVIDGILQGVHATASQLGILWVVVPVAVLMSLNAAGNASAWLAGSARIPFVIGIDRFLPAAFGRIHPRFHTPHVSLIVQAFASSLFIVISAIGASVRDMYLVLLQTTVILQLIPYLYMFAALIVIRRDPAKYGAGEGFFRSAPTVFASGATGFLVTLAGVLLAFVPPAGVTDIWNFEVKTTLGAASFLIPAIVLFALKARRTRRAGVIPTPLRVPE